MVSTGSLPDRMGWRRGPVRRGDSASSVGIVLWIFTLRGSEYVVRYSRLLQLGGRVL